MKNSKVDTPGVKNQKIMTKPSKERSIQDARLAALEKRNEQLQKSLEESLAKIKEVTIMTSKLSHVYFLVMYK